MSTTHVRLDRLVGRKVMSVNRRSLGRLEECRAEKRGHGWIVTEWIVGPAGLMERLHLGARLILGLKRGGGFAVRWDQLDLSKPEFPRLRCSVDELRRL